MITSFRGEYRFLSNFYHSPVDGYHTVEHAYQAAKTLNPDIREDIKNLSTPGAAKRAGKGLVLREDWESVKVEVMRDLLYKKFSDPILKIKLLGTGDQKLIEGNTWGDKIWGAVWDGSGWVGTNLLGNLLMEVREHYRNE